MRVPSNTRVLLSDRNLFIPAMVHPRPPAWPCSSLTFIFRLHHFTSSTVQGVFWLKPALCDPARPRSTQSQPHLSRHCCARLQLELYVMSQEPCRLWSHRRTSIGTLLDLLRAPFAVAQNWHPFTPLLRRLSYEKRISRQSRKTVDSEILGPDPIVGHSIGSNDPSSGQEPTIDGRCG